MEIKFSGELLKKLQERFEKNLNRHVGITWSSVLKKLEKNPEKLIVLHEMERTGGEPDVIGFDGKSREFIFCDCSPESPSGRRNLCYDQKALNSRKENKPIGSAMDMASSIGLEILSEQQYRDLQELGVFDKKSSSWVKTPEKIRTLGGALFCDRRYDHVFVYHNGAESYYSARGFRGLVRV